MAKHDLIAQTDFAFGAQLLTFKNNIAAHAEALAVTPAQVTAQAADADHYNYVITSQQLVLAAARGWTARRKAIRKGQPLKNVLPDNASFPTLALPPAVPPVADGVERRFRKLVRQIKAHANYTRTIGLELGIEAPDHAAPNFETIQPKIAARTNGSHVEIDWSWQGQRAFLDQCEIQVDRSDGHGFVMLICSVVPGYADTTPFPAAPVRWRYRAIYRVADAPVGQWSNIASVTVPP